MSRPEYLQLRSEGDEAPTRAEQFRRIEASIQKLICILSEERAWLQGFRSAPEGGAS